jgi:hypothetical protein
MFHVPERARIREHPLLGTTSAAGHNGAFDLESTEPGWRLTLICSDGTERDVPEGLDWEHVSVHAYRYGGRSQRCPTWREMCFVKDLCWDPEDLVIQYHPRRSEYVNNHPFTLHLWRPRHVAIPTPPKLLVGV